MGEDGNKPVFYSHVNYSVTKIRRRNDGALVPFYSHVNYSVTKMHPKNGMSGACFTVT